VPAGWGPVNSSTATGASTLFAMFPPAATHRYVVPSHSFAARCRPSSKSSRRCSITTAGSGARGWLSMAFTKSAWGRDPGRGTLLKGRSRSAVQSPDSTSRLRTASPERERGSPPPENDSKSAYSEARGSPDRSESLRRIVTDWSTRRAPRWIAVTSPAPGAVKRTPGRVRSSNSSWPRVTWSPSSTAGRARRP
jgi:hypothetical protein